MGPLRSWSSGSSAPAAGKPIISELTEQLCEGSRSARLAEFSAYYSNRMSYDEVGGLLERVTGQPVLSDQTMQHLVVTKAVWRSVGSGRVRSGEHGSPSIACGDTAGGLV